MILIQKWVIQSLWTVSIPIRDADS
jgi:hypothetical protein